MNDDFKLPHGLVAPAIESNFIVPSVLIGFIGLIVFFYLCFRMAKRTRIGRLSKYKQAVLNNVITILDMEKSNVLSQTQAYLLWRLIRKTGHYYFGSPFLKAHIRDSISMCVNTASNQTSKALFELFYQLNQAVYDPNKTVDKANIKELITEWLHDKQSLTMDSPT